ncbi:MAG: glycine cleavage system aminomethyltransferase GcvT [Candidatus Brocadiia bacterium]
MRTTLFDNHVKLGARMVDFAGWEMPVQYTGILREHRHTRSRVSLFDTCHMSEFIVRGPGAVSALQRALACRVDDLRVGRCRYGFLLNRDGGVIDDLICYRLQPAEYMIVANAGRREADAAALRERIGTKADFADASDETAKIDLQGPAALDALLEVADAAARELPYYGFARMEVGGADALVSRTGYTGELGYELYVAPDEVAGLWEDLLELPDVQPAGLGARDTLRLEMGYPLYGHELDERTTPVEAGLDWALPADNEYFGAEALARRHEKGIERRLVGVRFEGRRAAREGAVLLAEDEEVGRVTSGCFAPSVGAAVALGYVAPGVAEPGRTLAAEVRGSRLPGTVVELPFYRQGTARKKVKSQEGK